MDNSPVEVTPAVDDDADIFIVSFHDGILLNHKL